MVAFEAAARAALVQLAVMPCALGLALTMSSAAPYWQSAAAARSTPPEILKAIRAAPWRGALEPTPSSSSAAGPGGLRLESMEVVEGELPADLAGTLYKNGPGRIRIGEQRYGHWFDGDGFVTALNFAGDGTASFRAEYVKTERYVAQELAGVDAGIVRRGAWTQKAGGALDNAFRVPTNPGNTNLLVVDGRLLATCEGGLPIELDPITLETKGDFDFGGSMKSFFAAHSKIDPFKSRVCAFGLILGPGTPDINIMEANADGSNLVQHAHPLPFTTFVHDMGVTANHLVFMVPPWTVDPLDTLNFLAGVKAYGTMFKWTPEKGTWVLIADRNDLTKLHRVRLPEAVSLYHIISAHEDEVEGARRLTLNVARHIGSRTKLESSFANMYDAFFEEDQECEAWQYTFTRTSAGASAGAATEWSYASSTKVETAYPFELPDVNPGTFCEGTPARYAFVNALTGRDGNNGILDGIMRIDLRPPGNGASPVWTAGAGKFAGAPTFMPRQRAQESKSSPMVADGERDLDGYVLTYVYCSTTHTTQAVILDARAIEAGPVAVLQLPYHLPLSFHGTYMEAR